MRELILSALSQYGSAALFGVVAIASIGVPLPVTLLLIVSGSLVAQGVMPLWGTMAVAAAGAVVGDLIGYAIGRWGGAALVERFSRVLGGPRRLAQAEEHARRWGGPGVFLSRWLVTPLGAVINFTSGIAEYSWPRFVLWDVTGNIVQSLVYIPLGSIFSDRVLELSDLLGNLSWALVALVVTAWLGWLLRRAVKNSKRPAAATVASPSRRPEAHP